MPGPRRFQPVPPSGPWRGQHTGWRNGLAAFQPPARCPARVKIFASGALFRYCRKMMQPDLTVLTRRADFLAANKGLRVARPGFVLLARPNGGLGKRFGITVTKKIGNAVVRNRMKRRLRALSRELLPADGAPGADHVLIGREGGIERDFAAMRAELTKALAKVSTAKGTQR